MAVNQAYGQFKPSVRRLVSQPLPNTSPRTDGVELSEYPTDDTGVIMAVNQAYGQFKPSIVSQPLPNTSALQTESEYEDVDVHTYETIPCDQPHSNP